MPQQDTWRPQPAPQQGAQKNPKPPPPPPEARAEDQITSLRDQNLLRAEQALGDALTEEQGVSGPPGERKQAASLRRPASRPRSTELEVQALVRRISGSSPARPLLPVLGATCRQQPPRIPASQGV